MSAKTWAGAAGGMWGAGANWTPAGAPSTGDTAAITGLATGYQTIIGPGTGPGGASALKLVGNTALSGSFDFGTMTVGSSAVGGLTVLAGSTVQADTETLLQGTLDVVGTGARLVARGTLALGGARGGTASGFVRSVLTATNGAAIQAGSLALLPITGNLGSDAIQVDGTSTLEVGTAGGAALGKLTVDAGATLIGSADLSASNGYVNAGTIIARGGILSLSGGAVTGPGQIQIDPGSTVFFSGFPVSTADVVFNDNTGLLRLFVANGALNEQGRVTGFVPGDTIAVYSSQSTLTGVTYQAVSGGLGTLAIRSGAATVGSLTLAGNYSGYAFKLNQPFSNSYEVTAVAPAAPANAFLTTDTATSTSAATAGTAYAGPVIGLERQFIWASPHGVAMAATIGNTFIHGGSGDDALSVGSGTNVLDGGTGSNFLTGATGADGGTDTFFVDGRGGGVTWSTVVNFHRGDAVTIFGFPGTSTRPWTAVDGANGYQGATIHSELGGAGTGVNGSVTFAGVSLADAQNKFTISQGTVGDTPYLYVAYTG